MKKIAYLLLAAVALCSCSRESDLKKSIFIPDSDDSRLPAYTEWGYNTFGAYLDREVFIYNDNALPFKAIAYSTTTELQFNGEIYEEFHSNDEKVSLIVKTSSILLKNAEDFSLLNGKSYQLNDPSFQVYLERNGVRTKLSVGQGVLTFQRVQKIFIDRKYTEMILSGYFELSAMQNGSLISISDGRFDVGLKNGYNFTYQPI
ncbi:hypothetical protein [Acetobacteroides hydrogenigenes]|uniref:Uncharacterized protein n=1 Tax=Acetobacteroides hydrogenigenes TaxID=979970 RepID=A0A4V2RN93_9BACT|nr:hypothetical protein [Acetobacteroides hydrogenigenes]TCN62870.1 hypothetical protein CLV25_1175 [Acetobacteroides hydrogenigenes]